MFLPDMCNFLNSLSNNLDMLSPKDAKRFGRRFHDKTTMEENTQESLNDFVTSMKSFRCWMKDHENIHVQMKRTFSRRETLSGQVSMNMESFVYALGYHSIECQLSTDIDMINKKKCILYLASLFQRILPPVRSLQSLAYSATIKGHTGQLPELLNGNPTFSEMEKVETYVIYSSACSKEMILYCDDDPDMVNAFVFTTCLAMLEDYTKVRNKSFSHGLENGVFFNIRSLHVKNDLLVKSLVHVFNKIGKLYKTFYEATFRCEIRGCDMIGVLFNSPIPYTAQTLSHVNQDLFSDIKKMRKMYFHNKKECPCLECQQQTVAYNSCLYFVQGSLDKEIILSLY